MCQCVGGHHANRVAELGNGSLEVASTEQSAAGVGGERRGLQIVFPVDHLGASLAFGGGTGGVAQLAQNCCQRGVSASKIRIESNGLAQRIRRVRQLIHLFQDRAESVVGLGVVRLNLDRLPQLLRRSGEISRLPQGDSQAVVSVCQLRIEADRLLPLRNGSRQVV